jgi:hypothetical protein
MKSHLQGSMAAVGAGLLLLISIPAGSQNLASDAQRKVENTAGKPACVGCSVDGTTTPRMPDGHPDLNGFWNTPGALQNLSARASDGSVLFDLGGAPRSDAPRPGPNTAPLPATSASATENPSYKPEYDAKVKAIVDGQYGASTPEDPQYDCKPMGVPRTMLRGGLYGAFQIVQTPHVVAILFEASQGMNYRLIYTDGRKHPSDLDTSYLGDSVGHWEGDTLVVDVVGLNDETWLGGGQNAPKYALIHSDKEHVIERYTRKGDELTYEATVEDPVMFTKPWVIIPRRIKHANADDQLLEPYCEPHDKSHIIKPTEEDHYLCNYCVPDKSKK